MAAQAVYKSNEGGPAIMRKVFEEKANPFRPETLRACLSTGLPLSY